MRRALALTGTTLMAVGIALAAATTAEAATVTRQDCRHGGGTVKYENYWDNGWKTKATCIGGVYNGYDVTG
ncbi:hypothetical protein LX15_000098 [Streptoalloteichus tenebrarius]|uniref:Secreted protein n=1 Tax=Streptoalloteichus tenebrarius (strain ATCC 17920 / DSM 40477 / JCM 4838 / CBS 697.72 / NBRC 16177 / NCIMB 11028 / NRRL B-12390 / A12253. 1 / ISP 5477) TaxID=1933 RepID=A0ABT1HLL8_STRSD|nr:hypothetical protein [Streptoalloteichus tenebrarius]MCP2256415.1 hypothetical protein [Streptoalloteichus tenebrarius]BFF04764.1 hypothetical protein GCM10020241_64390 [Streptoalloteichus tenebrarius]